jgi:O-antigen/teichoic acid export membrane protein
LSIRSRIFHGSAVLTLGEGLGYGCSFIRNMILARLISKADFGVAATFAMVISLFEVTSKIGMSRFIVRDKDGDHPEFIGAAHFVQIWAGLLSATAIALAAWPIGQAFGLQNLGWAFVALASVSLMKGLENLDVRRFERELRFGPAVVIEAVPQVLITILAWPLAMLLQDFRAMLVLLIVKAVCTCVSSHFLAERAYRVAYHREYVGRMLKFGWPLALNGVLMFGIMQGGQIVVGTFYTMDELGAYSAAAALTLAPTFLFGRIFNSITLPLLAKAQDDQQLFHTRYQQCLIVLSAFSMFTSICFVVGAEGMMRLVFSDKYAGSGVLLAWLATANAFRNLRIAPALAALARGDTKNEMFASTWRALSLLLAVAAAVANQPVWVIAATGVAGEVLACFVAFKLLQNRSGIRISEHFGALLWIVPTTIMSFALAKFVSPFSPVFGVAVATGVALAAGFIMIASVPILRREVGNAFRFRFQS